MRRASSKVSTWAILALRLGLFNHLFTVHQRSIAQPALMDLKTKQRWERAACYEKIAEDESTRLEIRTWFAHQANLLRIMGNLAQSDEARISENKIRAA